ncbi:MAG: RidA family protein [Bacteroidetes bacterium]|nr:RidA family protein [Bacteroidota bacterium]MBS1628560.1 RidA family protein [Bacteroidota bacterium]
MEKNIIITSAAPAPIGPYSQAVLANGMLYISGQIPLDAQDGTLHTADIITETDKVMQNLKGILQAAGLDFSDVVKSSIFLTDMGQFSAVNEVYGAYFESGNAPARETIQVAALPRGVHVEISMIALTRTQE